MKLVASYFSSLPLFQLTKTTQRSKFTRKMLKKMDLFIPTCGWLSFSYLSIFLSNSSCTRLNFCSSFVLIWELKEKTEKNYFNIEKFGNRVFNNLKWKSKNELPPLKIWHKRAYGHSNVKTSHYYTPVGLYVLLSIGRDHTMQAPDFFHYHIFKPF